MSALTVSPSTRLAMVCASRSSIDGILDYAIGLGEALSALYGLAVDLVLRHPAGWAVRRLGTGSAEERLAPSLDDALEHVQALILHYNPFSWGTRGFAPDLVAMLARWRRRRPDVVIGLLAHEVYVDMHGVRWTLMGAWQRLQLVAIARLADVAWASTERWTEVLRRWTRARVAQIPISSNLPDRRAWRSAARARLGVDESTLVLATFGTGHPSRHMGHIALAISAIAGQDRSLMLLNLGSDAPPVPGLCRGVRLVAPGRLEASALAEHLSAVDLYLAPFIDGVSGRRTTLMAALQHGLAIVGTDGHLTDTIMRDARDALLLTPSSDGAAFAAAAGQLAADPERRARRGAAARRFYERHCDWPIACRVALAGLAGQG
jgi:glycosyltransferase involved in cell wall biosynthesis